MQDFSTERNYILFDFYLLNIGGKRRAKKLEKSLDGVSGRYLFLNHGTAHLFKLSATFRKDNPRSSKGRALTKFSASNSIMVNLRVTPGVAARKLFYTGTISCDRKVLSVFPPSLLYQPRGRARALSACRRGIKRCALCTVRHITGLTSPGKNLSAVMKEILTRVRQKKRAHHVRNVTENIFSTFREISSIGSGEKYRRAHRIIQTSSDGECCIFLKIESCLFFCKV